MSIESNLTEWVRQLMEYTQSEKMDKTTIFLSYCTADGDAADIVETSLLAYFSGNIKISRFTRDVGYRDSFFEFMKTMGKHDFVLSVISDGYLKSFACMFEVSEIIKDQNYKDKLLFIIISDLDKRYYKNPPSKKLLPTYISQLGACYG